MTELLKQALADRNVSLREIGRETGVFHQTMLLFMRGETSLRLDKADALAAYFGIESRPARRKGR